MHFFEKALPVWNTSLTDERNITVGLCSEPLRAGKYTFKAATSGFYRLFVNGAFVNFGPRAVRTNSIAWMSLRLRSRKKKTMWLWRSIIPI